MPLFTETAGTGPDMVLLHGFGLNAAVWSKVWPMLTRHYRVTKVDLPGHGRSRDLAGLGNPLETARLVVAAVPIGATWLAWSMGGLISLAAAHAFPAAIERLLLVGSSPSMVQRADWPHAIAPDILDGFSTQLETDYQATLHRFLALQCRGSEQMTNSLRLLRRALTDWPPHPQGLRDGLAILRNSDLRQPFAQLEQPVHVLLGARDRLVPAEVGRHMAALNPRAQIMLLKGVGHAPFLSHAQAFCDWIYGCLRPQSPNTHDANNA